MGSKEPDSSCSHLLYEYYTRPLNDPPFDEYFDLASWKDDSYSEFKEYRNFDPARIMRLLINRASANGKSPEEFHEDMQNIISVHMLGNKILPNHYNSLSIIYNLAEAGHEPDSITYSRLSFMFPHYFLKDCEFLREGFLIGGKYAPSQLYYTHFAGLIPKGRILAEQERKAIITVHLYILHERNKEKLGEVPMPIVQKILRRRIESSLISDEKRTRFLISKGIITPQLKLCPALEEIFQHLRNNSHIKEFMSKIDDRLM